MGSPGSALDLGTMDLKRRDLALVVGRFGCAPGSTNGHRYASADSLVGELVEEERFTTIDGRIDKRRRLIGRETSYSHTARPRPTKKKTV